VSTRTAGEAWATAYGTLASAMIAAADDLAREATAEGTIAA
jgi:hemoglobin-like flavoprotein